MSSKYNKYAQELNKAFTTAKEKYNDAYQAYQKAEQANNEAETPTEKITAAAELQKAKEELKQAQRDIWPEFQKKRDKLGKQLEAEVNLAQVVDPSELDENTVTLLNSGALTADDYEKLAEDYKDNATMSRLIAKGATELGNTSPDPAITSRMNELSYKCNHTKPAVLNKWDSLAGASGHYSGEYNRNAEPGLVCSLSEHWADDDVQEAIKNF